MATKQLTYEGVLKMFRKTDRKIREVAEQQAKVAEQQAKTDRQIERMSTKVERVSTEIGRLGNRIGDIIEHMVGGENIVEQFRALNYNVTGHSRNRIFGKGTENYGEIDLILEDGDIAILISVKTKLTTGDVRQHIDQLEKYRRHVDAKRHGDKLRFIGAVAGAVADQNVVDFAQKKGFYVIVQSGVAVEIVPAPENFRAKEW